MNMDDSNIFFTPPAEACRAGMRLDLFLKENLPQMSRARLQKLIAGGFVGAAGPEAYRKECQQQVEDSFQVGGLVFLFWRPAVRSGAAGQNGEEVSFRPVRDVVTVLRRAYVLRS